MKDKHNKNEKKWAELLKDKRFYYSLIAGGIAVLAIVFVATLAAITKQDEPTLDAGNSSQSSADSGANNTPNDSASGDSSADNNKPVDAPQGMVLPVNGGTLTNDYGFFYNQTLNAYYEHVGVDFSAAAGTQVVAAQAGTVEGVYTGDALTGTEIIIDHGNGVKTVYHFVQAVEGLSAGDKVERGEVIATIADANGSEYKDGAHLHFEVLQNGENIDPATLLELNEK